jgi:hypothetical protein
MEIFKVDEEMNASTGSKEKRKQKAPWTQDERKRMKKFGHNEEDENVSHKKENEMKR